MGKQYHQYIYNPILNKGHAKPMVWEVWLAEVSFENRYQAKKRPVIVLDVDTSAIDVIGMTSRLPKYSKEFLLKGWQRAGLKYQSTVKAGRVERLQPNMFIHKIGDLGIADIEEIQSYIYQPISHDGYPSHRSFATKGGCYIATAVYGSYDCPAVWVLRRYRDYALARFWHGRLLINLYYAASPVILKFFYKNKWFNKFSKNILNRLVAQLKNKGWDDSPYSA